MSKQEFIENCVIIDIPNKDKLKDLVKCICIIKRQYGVNTTDKIYPFINKKYTINSWLLPTSINSLDNCIFTHKK